MASFDLQSILQLPHSNASQYYYKRKLCMYNLTVHDGKTRDGHCYMWSELHGHRGSSEISTAVMKFLQSLPETVKSVYLWSDTCSGQNRNQNMAAMLMAAVQLLPIEELSLNFLESGHTHMEVDSMHSVIERSAKVSCIYTMEEWQNVMVRARLNQPYLVHMLHHKDFIDAKSMAAKLIKNRSTDTEGNKVNWLEIKSLKFEKAAPGVFMYRTSHTSDYKVVQARPTKAGRQPIIELPKLYDAKLVISAEKKDVLSLCKDGLIPPIYHQFYRDLKSSACVPGGAEELSEGEVSDDEAENVVGGEIAPEEGDSDDEDIPLATVARK